MTMKIAGVAMGVPLAMMALSGCVRAAATAAPQAATVQVDSSRNGQTVPVRVGDEVSVVLDAQMGTGFSWKMQPLNSAVVEVSAKDDLRSPAQPLPGGAEQQVFHLRAQQAGNVTLTFLYQRPWEKDKPPAKTFTVTLTARPS